MRDIVDDPEHGGRVSVSLPSLRVDAFTVGTAAEIQKVRRTGLTFAPEGGTWRMRTVINKLITEEDLYSAVDAAFSQGWRRVKLYFLIGLPTELDEDVLGIAALGARCVEIGRKYHKAVTVTASVGGFVPKPHTPFQWFGQDTVAELERKVALLREEARRTRGLTIRWHEPAASVAEGLASRGDRRMGAVIERVWRAGGTFQEWSERFDLSLWEAALAAEGLSVDEVCHRDRGEDEPLPWDHISAGLHRDFLWGDWQDALAQRGRRGLPLDPLLRLWSLHRRRPGARGGLPGPAGGREPGDRPGPHRRGPHPRAPGQPCFLTASAACASVSPRQERSASRVTGTWLACGSGRCGEASCPWRTRKASRPIRSSASGSRFPPVASHSGEYLDLRLAAPGPGETPVAALPAALSALLPVGIDVEAAALIGEAEGSLQQEVASCDWELEVLGVPGEELQERVEKLLSAPILTVRRERKGRQVDDDIRPAIRALSVSGPDGHLRAELATHPRGVRPGDLVTALGTGAVSGRACRTHQWIEREGARFEPLTVSRPGTGAVATTQNARRATPHVGNGNQPEPGGSPPGAAGGQQHPSP